MKVQTPPPAPGCNIPLLTSGLDDLGLGVVLFGEKGHVQHISPYADRLLSWILPDEEKNLTYQSLLTTFFELALQDDEIDWADLPLGSFTHQSAIFSEVLRGNAGHYVWAQVTEFNKNGVMVILQDARAMIARAREEHRKAWQHKMLLDALEHSSSGVLLFDHEHARQPVLFANQAVCDILSRRRDYILGQNWKGLLPNYNPDITDRFEVTMADGVKHKIAAQLSIKGKLGLLFLADVTSMDQKETQLQHMQKLDQLGQLAGGVAHDFNNILGVIGGYGHLLQGWVRDDTRAAPAVTSILNACARGASLSNKLLAFSRVKAGTSDVCVLQDVASHLQDMMAPLLPSLIELSVMMPSTPVGVACSDDHLMQILMNLVINARDAMPERGGHITVQAMTTPHFTVRITVRDNGSGMPPEVQARIFEPFFTTKEVGKGTGLGLAMVYGLIKQHQGKIEVASTPGVGTTFTIDLPVVDLVIQRNKNDIPDKAVSGASLHGKVVVLVDDEDDARAALKIFLEEQGMRVLEAESADAALTIQDEFDDPIDLLMSDIRMPGGLYGDDLARLWRDIRPDSKIVLMSGFTENRAVDGDIADAFMPKPIDFGALPRLLQNVFVSSSRQKIGA